VTRKVKRILQVGSALALLVPLLACGKKIGDECQTNFDCNDEDDTRTCDISQPGGYCTIEGCDERSCPEESVCVRFFPRQEFLTRMCTAGSPDQGASECAAHELCLVAGLCAPRATELRRCVKTCDNSGDCRGGYECRSNGADLGDGRKDTSMPLTGNPANPARFCAPRG
jgi:hypothetical protein